MERKKEVAKHEREQEREKDLERERERDSRKGLTADKNY